MDHQIDLATALGEEAPDVSRLRKRKAERHFDSAIRLAMGRTNVEAATQP
jgi:hypothetical protein